MDEIQDLNSASYQLTLETVKKSEYGKDLIKCEDINDMFKKLGI